MTFKTTYKLEDVLNGHANSEFNNNSVIKIENLFDEEYCAQIRKFILDKEEEIIEKYISDKKGLVLDHIENKRLIKYFEYPFSFDKFIFGKFSQSDIYQIAETLLQEKVCIFSMEIHSRIALGTKIPAHQDNAYYGLKRGKALTFYIPLDKQNPFEGGLRYFSNPVNNEYDHIFSKEKGFSLTLSDKNKIINLKKLDPYYNAGDCTIHHSRSVHYAKPVPPGTERGLVLRMSFFSIKDKYKANHDEWYKNIVNQNRL